MTAASTEARLVPPMRILAIATLYPLSNDDYVGQARHVSFRALQAQGHEIHVVRAQRRLYQLLSRDWKRKSGQAVPRQYELDGVQVVCPRYWRLPGRRWRVKDAQWRYGSIRREVRRIHDQRPFDLIYGCELMPDGVVAVKLGRELNVPVMVSSIGSDAHTYPYESPLAMEMTCRVLREADLILVEGAGAEADVRKLASDIAPVRVFSRGIDLARLENAPARNDTRCAHALPINRKLVIFVGALNESKGVLDLVRAFTQLHGRHADADLVLIGAGSMSGVIRTEADAGGWGRRLHLLGRQPFSKVPHLLMACDVFCLPSHGEGLPKSVVEAMAAGLPVVATTVGGIPDVMSHGECGLLVSPHDPGGLASALSRLLANPVEAARMGKTGREVAYREFDTRKNASGILKFAEEAIARGKERMACSGGK